MNKETEKYIADLRVIVNGIGTMSMEYWGDREEKSATKALDHLAQVARDADRLRMKIGADDDDSLVVAVEKAFGCGDFKG